MKKKWRRILHAALSILIIIGLVLPSFTPGTTYAETSNPIVPTIDEQNEETKEPPKELPELRTETSKVFEHADGTLTAEVSLEPIHYKQKTRWVDIDNTLVNDESGQSYVNKQNQFKVNFKKNVSKATEHSLFSYEINEKKIEIMLSPLSQVLTNLDKLKNAFSGEKKDNKEMLYKDIMPGISFEYEVDGSKVKENIVLNSYQGIHTFQYFIKGSGLTAKKQTDGSITFSDTKTGKSQFYLHSPFMYETDALHEKSENVSHAVTQTIIPVIGGFILTLNADANYLKDPKRKFPVVIDPWIDVFNTQDTFVAEKASTTNYSNLSYLSIGTDTTLGKTRSLAKWTLPDIPNANVLGASIGLYQSTNLTNSVAVHNVTKSYNTQTVTWGSQPTIDNTPVTSPVKASGYSYFSVDNLVKGWYDKSIANNGVLLKYETINESKAAERFHSSEFVPSDNSDYKKPKLVISFRQKKLLGINDYWTYTPDIQNGEGTEAVNVINGNMIYSIPLLSLPSVTNAFQLGLTYNSRSNYQHQVGYGWVMNAGRRLIPSSDNQIVRYIDDSGTEYHFAKQQSDTSVSYSSPEGTYFDLIQTANGYRLTYPDETVYEFDASGRNTKVIDENGNTIQYVYSGTSFQLTSINEVSPTGVTNRSVQLQYNSGGLLERINDFKGTQIYLKYNELNSKSYLESITYASNRAESKTVTFQYNDSGSLQDIFNPNGEKGSIYYDPQNRVVKMTDPRSTSIFSQLDYLSDAETVFTDARGVKTYYQNNIDLNLPTVNVGKIVDNYGAANAQTTIYKWDKNNNIEEIIEPNPETGDADGTIVTKAQYDDKGNQTLLEQPGNLKTVSKYDDKSNLTKETSSNKSEDTLVYDENSNLVNGIDSYWNSSYMTNDMYGNTLTQSSISNFRSNRLLNGAFEYADTNAYPTNWNRRAKGSYALSGTHKYGKKSAVLSVGSADGFGYLWQDVPVMANETEKVYTVSGAIRADGLNGQGAYLQIYFKDSSGQFIKDSTGNALTYLSSAVNGTSEWVDVSKTVTIPAGTATVHIECVATGVGNAYFDGVQLVYGKNVNRVSANENPSFDWKSNATTPTYWTLNSLGANDKVTAVDANGLETASGYNAFKINGAASKSYYVGQTVEIEGKTGDSVTLSGWSLGKDVNASGGDYLLKLAYVYTDGTESNFTIPFDKKTTGEWQFRKKSFKAAKNFSRVKVYAMYVNQTGSAYFSSIKVDESPSDIEFTYSSDGRDLLSVTDSLGQKAQSTYDGNGNLTEWTNPRGNKQTLAYDMLNQLTSATLVNPSGTSITSNYLYDKNGNLTSRRNPRGYDTQIRYNALNLPILQTGPLGSYTATDYDEIGNVKSVEAGKNGVAKVKTDFVYNAKGLLSETKINNQTRTAYTYNLANELTKLVDQNGQTYNYKYDANHRLTESADPTGYTLKSTFDISDDDNNGMRTAITETLGSLNDKTAFVYDRLQRLLSVTNPKGVKTEYAYNEAGKIARVEQGTTSVFTDYTTTNLPAVTQVRSANPFKLTYGYDANGNMNSYFDGKRTHSFSYDFAERLSSWTYNGTTTSYQFDEAGNWLNPNGKTLTYNAENQINGYTYDELGQLLQDDRYAYTWDSEGNLASVSAIGGATIASYTYYPDGLRKSKTTGGTTYRYYYDDDTLIRITNASTNQTLWSFTWANGQPVSFTNQSGQTFMYVTNYRGDVISIVDQAGAEVANYSYDPWGRVLSKTESGAVQGQPIGYASYVYDTETTLYYLQARYYNPLTGNFLSLDPDRGDLDDPLSQNGYSYVNGNPVTYIDPSGYSAVIAVYFVPGLGEIALMATGAVFLGGIAYKAGTWIGQKAKNYYVNAQNNKQIKKRIEGLENQVRKHRKKISNNPSSIDKPHWEKEIAAFEKEIARIKKRLKK